MSIEVVVTGYSPISLDVTVPQGADGITFVPDKPTLAIASLSDGSSPVLTDAIINISVMRGINNDTASWVITATPTGCTGTLVDHTTYSTFTVEGMTSDTATVAFSAVRTGFATLSSIATLSKVKQVAGVTHTSGTLTIDGSANSANIPTANEKTRLSDIQAATGATTVEKLSMLVSGSTAGYTHLTKLAAAEAETALWDYDTAAKMPPALLREIVEAASNGAATVKVDDLGFPSMMYILSGPKMLGYLHADYGSTTGLKTAVLANPGSGYTALDVLAVAGGTGGTIRVLTVDGSGAVLTFRFANRGTEYSAATGAVTTGGTGTNCTVTTTIGPVHPAFIVNGVEKNEILYPMFDATSYNGSTYNGSGAGWRAICWPGLFPTASLDFDVSKTLCTAKGAGWHLGSIWENNLIALLAMKGATEPRGNTQYGQTHESGYQFNETAVRSDGLAPGLVSGTAKHRNGSGPRFWSHNHDRWGIHDMVGQVWRWTDQLKLFNGEVFLTDDNYYGLAEASWPTTGAFFDGNGKLWGSVHAGAYVASVVHTSQVMDASYDSLDLEIRAKLLKAGVTTKLTQASANPFAPKGSLWASANAERMSICGGGWSVESSAGLATLNVGDPRSNVLYSIGFRPSYIAP